MSNRKLSVLGRLVAAIAVFGSLVAGNAYATSGTIDVEADVVLQSTLPLSSGSSLSFGTATITASPGMLTMPTDNDIVSFSGGITDVDLSTARRGSFSLTAPDAGTFQITFKGRTTMANFKDASKTLYLAPAVSLVNPVATYKNQSIDVYVGGVIMIPANTSVGAYHGVISVSVDSK